MKKTIVLITAIFLWCITVPVWGAEYYVDSSTGSDSYTGTAEEPFQTLAKAVSVISGGDTLYCSNTFTENITISASLSGTAEALTTITSTPSENCVIDSVGNTTAIELEDGANYVRLKNLTIINAEAYGILSDYENATTNLEIISNSIYGLSGAGVTMGIYLTDADNSLIADNAVYSDGIEESYGIWISSSSNIIIEKNVIHDLTITGLAIDHDTTDALVMNNLIYNIGGSDSEFDLAGIYVLNTHDVELYNNTLSNCADESYSVPAIKISKDPDPWGSETYSISVKNNIVGDSDYGIYITEDTETGFDSDYNDFYNNSLVGQYLGTDADNLAAWQLASVQDANSIDTDPGFISLANFHLQTSSLAIDAGVSLANVASDYDGEARPQGSGYDIGYDEVLAEEEPGEEEPGEEEPGEEEPGEEEPGEEEPGEEEDEVVDYTPSKVKNLRILKKYRKAKRVTLAWKKKPNASGYILRIDKYLKKTKKYKKLRIVKINTNKKKKIIKKLKPNTKYRVKIRAKRKVSDTVYKGAWSKIINFKTKSFVAK